jgi:hypothetical protein
MKHSFFAATAAGVVALMLVNATASADSPIEGEPYAHRRSIDAPTGFARLELPDDVLDACRPGLVDLRIVDARGQVVPFAQGSISEVRSSWSVRDVERSPAVETTAIVDRGERPVDIDAITVLVEGASFLKPTIVEASDDKSHWKELARASIFATGDPTPTRMTRISFAPSSRRYLRLRLDDKNGDAVTILGVRGHAAGSAFASPREIRGIVKPATDVTPTASTYTVELPAAHLGIVGLRLETTLPAFARDVRVFDRVMYRGEMLRRSVGAAHLVRGPTGEAETVVPVAEPRGRTLEVEVNRVAGQALPDVGFVALVTPAILVLYATGLPLTLLYGSATAPPRLYDLGEALAGGLPADVGEAHLGPDQPTQDAATSIGGLAAHLGASVDSAAWRVRRSIALPASGSLAFVAVGDRAEQLATLRIVDEEDRQLPYIVEREPRLRMETIAFADDKPSQPETSALTVTGIDPMRAIDAIEINAKEPFFEREVWIEEAAPRRRDRPEISETRRRTLGNGRWVRLPEQNGALRVPIAQPSQDQLWISFRNGAERPLTITRVSIERVERRLDFPYSPAQKLALLSDNPTASAPTYDLALIADRIAELPAEPATLGPAELTGAPSPKPGSRWLWVAVAVAALGVTVTLARTLRAAPVERDPPAS